MTSSSLFANAVGSRNELVLIAAVVGILLILFTPIPAWMLDFLLIINISSALLVLLMTLYTDKPLEFSTFPTLLLITTMFRLALNIASTRLILNHGDAGQVIGAVGTYVVAGNYVIGLVVFLILVVVQYVVVTSGAQRVAEVAARFTLDSMPGKQMSIDADMNMGLIDDVEARSRRKEIEREASFYGAMDGASKFVKGDAIAGILIILINIIGGLVIGVAQIGMPWAEALHKYTLLTVGDGIVTQIPALVISTATGIIVTRAATDARFGEEIANQVSRYPRSLVIVCIGLVLMLFLPGIPAFPVSVILAVFGALAFLILREKPSLKESDENNNESEGKDLYSAIEIVPIELKLGSALTGFFGDESKLIQEKLSSLREQIAFEFGFVIPSVKIIGAADHENEYVIRFHGNKVASGMVFPGKLMAISSGKAVVGLDGLDAKEPSYGLPAKWITTDQKEKAKEIGCTIVEPLTVLMTHFSEVIRSNSSELLTRTELEQLMIRVRSSQPGVVDELIPNLISLSEVQKILQRLLKEKVSIRSIGLIFEALLEAAKMTKDLDSIVDAVRIKCARSICEPLLNKHGVLHVLTMEPSLEQIFHTSIKGDPQAGGFVEPKITDSFVSSVMLEAEKMMAQGLPPVLLCSPVLRRYMRKLIDRILPSMTVLSLNEVPGGLSVTSFGMIRIERK